MGPDVYNQMLREVHILSREGHIFCREVFLECINRCFCFWKYNDFNLNWGS